MNQQGFVTTVLVDDFDTAIGFYCVALEQFLVESDTQLGAGHREVLLTHKYNEGFGLNLRYGPPLEQQKVLERWPLLLVWVSDCDAAVERLEQHGVTAEEVNRLPYGIQATVCDPSGNRITLIESWLE